MKNYIIILFHLNHHLFIKTIHSNMRLDILISSKNVDLQADFTLKKILTFKCYVKENVMWKK